MRRAVPSRVNMEGGISMSEDNRIIKRQDLYDEIWKLSALGVAKKYNISNSALLKICKDASIPIPPAGYWTKIEFGKEAVRTPLPKTSITEVNLSGQSTKRRTKKTNIGTSSISKKQKIVKAEDKSKENIVSPDKSEDKPINTVIQTLYRTVAGKHNTYNREVLYQEVWSEPVSTVALRYGVSDVTIHKICKSLDVPVPPRGYWAKLKAGSKIKKTPLPVTKGMIEKVGIKTFEGIKEEVVIQRLSFLSEDELNTIIIAAQNLELDENRKQLHKKIVAYKSIVKDWNSKNRRPDGSQMGTSNYSHRPPFLAGVISDEALPRVYRILDALFCQIESLDGDINDDLSLRIRGEEVRFEVTETQDKVDHVITRQEAQEIIKYEDAKKHHSWAFEPKIRKYDYIFNGRLCFSAHVGRYIRDTEKVKVESRLGDILIDLYDESESVRIDREKREEEARKRKDEERRKEEQRNLYNHEVEKTTALINAAKDYQIASTIRDYISAVAAHNTDDEWIDWAKKKADWFDPTVARKDEIFGMREHEKSEEQKLLKKYGYYW